MKLILSDSITLSRPWKHYARSLSIVIGESVKHWVSRCPSFSNFSIPRSCTNVFLHCFSICWWIPWRLFEKNRISIFLIIRSRRTKALPAYFKLLMDYDHSMFIHELQKFCDLYNNEDYMIREVCFWSFLCNWMN